MFNKKPDKALERRLQAIKLAAAVSLKSLPEKRDSQDAAREAVFKFRSRPRRRAAGEALYRQESQR